MANQDETLDVTGKTCPMPLIEIHRLTSRLDPDQCARIVGDDPIFEDSVRDYCDQNHFEVLDVAREGRRVTMVIRRAAGGMKD